MSTGAATARDAGAALSTALVLPFFVGAHIMMAVDQSIVAITLEPIKHEFRLTDTQLGLLTGFGFSLFCGVIIIPIGRLVDLGDRKRLLVGAIALFSLMTTTAVVTATFAQLFVTRLFVGAGEAAAKPVMTSMLSDVYPPHRRAGAMATFYAGQPLGSILAFLLGGWIAQHFGWRAVFLLSGIPGIFIALAIFATVNEPIRRTDSGASSAGSPPTFGATIRFILSQRAACHVLLTPAVGLIATSGVAQFTSSLFIRNYGLSISHAGFLIAFLWGGVGVVGSPAGGWIVDKLAPRDQRWAVWYCAIAYLLAIGPLLLMTFAPSVGWAAAGLAAMSVTTYSTVGPATAIVQSLVKPRMRGSASAIYILLSYLVGSGFGPFVVGVLSDAFAGAHGGRGLRYAIGVMPIFYVWAAVHFLLAGRTLRSDLKAAASPT